MKCPKCGNPNCRYVVSRKKNWKGRGKSRFGESTQERTDFTVKCPKCGFKGEIR
jgi:uncharacterized Zn finger protein